MLLRVRSVRRDRRSLEQAFHPVPPSSSQFQSSAGPDPHGRALVGCACLVRVHGCRCRLGPFAARTFGPSMRAHALAWPARDSTFPPSAAGETSETRNLEMISKASMPTLPSRAGCSQRLQLRERCADEPADQDPDLPEPTGLDVPFSWCGVAWPRCRRWRSRRAAAWESWIARWIPVRGGQAIHRVSAFFRRVFAASCPWRRGCGSCRDCGQPDLRATRVPRLFVIRPAFGCTAAGVPTVRWIVCFRDKLHRDDGTHADRATRRAAGGGAEAGRDHEALSCTGGSSQRMTTPNARNAALPP
jgi:hypothetical protein